MATNGQITRLKINDGSEKIYTIGGEGGGSSGGSAECVLATDKWIKDPEGPGYYQIVEISGMESIIIPIIDLKVLKANSEATTAALLEAWSNIYSAESSSNRIFVYSYKQLTTNLTILVKW